jgi:hypothetical protein
MYGTGREGKSERRRQPRSQEKAIIRILWQDPFGPEQMASAKLVDVSPNGICLAVDRKIPIGSFVLCNELKLKLSGRGSVRYCVLRKAHYHIGVEFSAGTGWQPEEELVAANT